MILTGLCFGQGAYAQARNSSDVGIIRKLMTRPADTLNLPAKLSPYMQMGIPFNDTNSQRLTLEALIGSSVEPLKWPELPRVWWRFEDYEGGQDTKYFGFQYSMSKVTGSTKHAFTVKYSQSVSFVLIGSLRSVNQLATPDTSVDGKVLVDKLIYNDPVSGALYPNVREDYPMVGLCMYDMQMASETSHTLSGDVLGNGASHETMRGFGTPFTLYSNFFQLDPNKPIISHYILERCQKMFASAAKEWVEDQFKMFHRAYRTETKSTCKRERGGTDRTSSGDKGCFKWFSELPDHVRASTVPRCERQDDDLFHCTAKVVKAGTMCPFRQGNDAKFVPSTDFGSLRPLSGPCDDDAGLVCEPTLPLENIKNLEKSRLFLDRAQLDTLGVCKPRSNYGPRRR